MKIGQKKFITTMVLMKCPVCLTLFERQKSKCSFISGRSRTTACSRSCSRKLQGMLSKANGERLALIADRIRFCVVKTFRKKHYPLDKIRHKVDRMTINDKKKLMRILQKELE